GFGMERTDDAPGVATVVPTIGQMVGDDTVARHHAGVGDAFAVAVNVVGTVGAPPLDNRRPWTHLEFEFHRATSWVVGSADNQSRMSERRHRRHREPNFVGAGRRPSWLIFLIDCTCRLSKWASSATPRRATCSLSVGMSSRLSGILLESKATHGAPWRR